MTNDAERVSDIVADWWAVWSETGMHIGTWSDEAIARSVFLGQYPKGTIRHLVSADIIEAQSKALAEASAGHVLIGYIDEQGHVSCDFDSPIKAIMAAIPDPPVGRKLVRLYASVGHS